MEFFSGLKQSETMLGFFLFLMTDHLVENAMLIDPTNLRIPIHFEGYIEKRRCSMVDISNVKRIWSTARDLPRGTVKCQFNPTMATCYGRRGGSKPVVESCFTEKWFCSISKDYVCDGESYCLDDECHCGWQEDETQIFYCSDGAGCVRINMVCDGIYDCLDQSDELMCDGLTDFNCTADTDAAHAMLLTLPKYAICTTSVVAIAREVHACDRAACNNFDYNTASSHMDSCRQNISYHESMIHVPNRSTHLCVRLCADYGLITEEQCARFVEIDRGVGMIAFKCPVISEAIYRHEIPLESVCDGTIDCSDYSDEIDCMGRFYCTTHDNESGPVTWVAQSAVCDGMKDCKNGLDECSNCSLSYISSDQFIIRNYGIFAWLVISCAANLVLNLLSGVQKLLSKWRDLPRHVKVDKILKLQLCFYDSLLGIYLLALVIANLRYHGNYCFHDYTWRSSWMCKCLGILYNASSHGSLLSVFLMSLTRAHKCFFTYSTGMSIRAIVIISAILALLNIANSVIPIIPTDSVQTIFRVKFAMSQSNPFIMEDFHNITHVHRLHSQYFGKNYSNLDLYQKIDELREITNQPSYFDFYELSYYSWSSVCVNDIFGFKESLQFYKLTYIACISCLLLSITVFYVVILKVFVRSRKVVNPTNDEDDKEFYLKVKVILMIGSKLLPWLTIIGAIIYYNYTRKNVPELWYQVTAICIIPANSLLNPIFDSGLLEHIPKLVGRCIVAVAKQRQAPRQREAIELREHIEISH